MLLAVTEKTATELIADKDDPGKANGRGSG